MCLKEHEYSESTECSLNFKQGAQAEAKPTELKNPCYRCYPCGTKHKQVLAAPKIYRMIRYILVNIYNNKLQKIELVIKEAINYLFRSTAVER